MHFQYLRVNMFDVFQTLNNIPHFAIVLPETIIAPILTRNFILTPITANLVRTVHTIIPYTLFEVIESNNFMYKFLKN